MNNKKILKKQYGLSLIEIVVALTILGVVFIGLVQSFPFGLSVSKEGSDLTTASFLAQSKIEELISLNYENIIVGTIEPKARLSADPSNYYYYFQRETIVSYVDGSLNEVGGDQGMKKISTTVYFINAVSKTEKNYNITSLVSRR